MEENPAAVRDAEANAEINGIENARFVAQPRGSFFRAWGPGRPPASLTVVLDPPRAGCAPAVLNRSSPFALQPSFMCPAIPARSRGIWRFLPRGGYQVQEVQPVDLFPHTPHIETVVKLTRMRKWNARFPKKTRPTKKSPASSGNPKTIAVIGASPKRERPSHWISIYLKDHGYKVIPVNPGHMEILGDPCYKSLSDVPNRSISSTFSATRRPSRASWMKPSRRKPK